MRSDAACCAVAGANLKTIAAALEPAKELKWLVLRTAGVVGNLECDIILPTLTLLSLTRNGLMVSQCVEAGPCCADKLLA